MAGIHMSPIDSDVKEILDEHKAILDEHSDDIEYLKATQARMDERLINIEKGQQEVINTVLQSNNAVQQTITSMTQTMSQIVISLNENRTQKEISKDNNKTQIEITKDNNRISFYGKLLLVVAAFFSGSKASNIWTAIKEIFK